MPVLTPAFPPEFPAAAIAEAISVIRSRKVTAQTALAAWIVAGYALGQTVGSPTPTMACPPCTDEELCERLECACDAQSCPEGDGRTKALPPLPWGLIRQILLEALLAYL